ncbi:MAG: LPS-assembly protein [Blastocatellia bacterium]|jgi:LPS-assembly protein|nr:LPS-assembly protein [Blastocatellia bacterium]
MYARLVLLLAVLTMLCAARPLRAQQTNPVDREVTNPITDTPNVNPLSQEQPVVVRPRASVPAQPSATAGQPQQTQELDVRADKSSATGQKDALVVVHEGNVDARIGVYRLQADKVTVYEATNKVIAEGNVVFDQSTDRGTQRITGTRAEWNYSTKLGFFINSTGFTNQTEDGTTIYYTADSVEKVSIDTIVAINATITACDEDVPKWSFKSKRVKIKIGDRVRVSTPNFRVKGVPVLVLPYASISIKRRDRASGFLTPTFSGSGAKGFRLSNAYYQTLGRSADVTFRNDIYAARGLGFGADIRTRANSRSFLDFGFFAVKDRIFGEKAGPGAPDQGGSSFYVKGVHYFPNGFLAAADVNITSNLAFRQVFSDSIQQAISPEERSQVFINKNFGDYSFDFLARSQVTSLPSARIRIRQLPSVTLDKRPSALRYFERLPVYFSISGGLEGVSRKETIEDADQFAQIVGSGRVIDSPSIVQRLDVHPRFSVPVYFGGWSVTGTLGLRGTYYSNSIDPSTRLVLSRDVVRGYGEFELDVRPPAFARNFRHRDDSFFFRHVIEPYIIYRKIEGVTSFERIIRFDYNDTVADTNEIEYGLVNRFFTRRSTENVSPAARRAADASGHASLSSQPYEALTITVRGKYFFDPYFGGALVPGQRNQFYPINTFSGFTYGGVPRRFSPINVEGRYRPSQNLFADARTDLDVQGSGLRNLAVSFGLSRRLVKAFTTFYYTRAIELAPSLSRFADARGFEAGTLRGSQWSPTLFLGDPNRGLFGGVSFFFDFQDRSALPPDRPVLRNSSLVSSVVTAGYTWDCCSVTVQNYTFNVGLRSENRFVFSFRLNGIGTFGTEQIGQNFR